ncbi:MAG: threonine ammonia-lyase [Bacteroidota bacterium]
MVATSQNTLEGIYDAAKRLEGIADLTPLQLNANLSEQYQCNIFLKREDLQVVRSYKIRGAYNKMSSLPKEILDQGVVCASAGNHAQGFAFACQKLGVKGKIYMPSVTPQQKVTKVKKFGKDWVEIVLVGDTFDDAFQEAMIYSTETGKAFIHPFNDIKIIEGQGTVALEILNQYPHHIDYLIAPIGGGGLIAGCGIVFSALSPKTLIIGVEPAGAPAMFESIKQDKIVTLNQIDNFVDGAAVKKVGEINFPIVKKTMSRVLLVDEGKVCHTLLQLYNDEGFVVEPAGTLSIAALDDIKEEIKGKTVVCIVSGSNNDITRTEEIRERALLYNGLKHYFIIRFPQRAGALREFLNHVLGPNDDITHFEYTKKNNRELGPALVGIQVKCKEDYDLLLQRMNENGLQFQSMNESKMLYELLV